MFDVVGASMVEEETEAVLAAHGHGVLALARDDEAYGVPVSYGYDEAENRVVFQFFYDRESKKREFVEHGGTVTLTVTDWASADDWRSAIVTGELQRVPDSEVSDRLAAVFFEQAEHAAPAARRSTRTSLTREWYQLPTDDLTGRTSTAE
ncbi:pyridoxamine 5'-phosphate oxidase family protein [Halorarius litoreus]|uniref:pyridoxamine 5'-phosphate oxidase family protein n=1 Tax=Halorarius litoreus TaxID=2962676 RepID=UPI0020CE56FF|nr:pyridoxamine 5'-phosphate oxidase family protein [Halorarius litoreus]